MIKLLFNFTFLFLIFGCTSNIDKLQGNWELRLHEYYDLSTADGGKLIEAPKPFNKWEFEEALLKIDGSESFLTIKEDLITTIIEGEFRHFTIEKISETSMLLKSEDLTPGTTSFYYFLK